MDIKEYIKQLHSNEAENAYHSLIEMDSSVVKLLIDEYYSEKNKDIKIILIEIINEHRCKKTLDFYSDALKDEISDIWQAALDGIVLIGGDKSIKLLEEEKSRLLKVLNKVNKVKLEWINEAIEQINNGF